MNILIFSHNTVKIQSTNTYISVGTSLMIGTKINKFICFRTRVMQLNLRIRFCSF
uniref:Uncharacterized protein n=1 Tax=Ciona intestinalis TaxID=7719 RepID=H2XUY2_CIOIN